LAQKENGHEVLGLLFAQRKNFWIARFSFGAAVPTEIVVIAIAIVLAIGFIVLPVVAD
jgi:alpha/beta superfamily hydrolase